MANAVMFDYCTELASTFEWPASRGVFVPSGLIVFTRQSLPDDPVGTHTLTLTNVVVGSRIAIRDQGNTTTLYDQVAAASTVVIPLSVYAGGSALNNWRIRIRKSSAAPKYLPYETLMTATPGSSSIYVSQLPDPIAS
jgi:hypothetical protein